MFTIIVHGQILNISFVHMEYLKVEKPQEFSLASWDLVGERRISLWRSPCSNCL